ncbi:MAG TPA: helix-turn-helix domain-containing protein, partial [Streptosporangiaceae bacterium]
RQADADPALTAVCSAVRQRAVARVGSPVQPGDRTIIGASASDPVIAVGSAAPSMAEVRRSLLEAQQVADAAAQSAGGGGQRPFYRLADLRVRGLLRLLQGDMRLATFIDRELGALIAYDQAHGTDLIALLATYLAEGGNKAAAAARTHLARPTLYERLRHIERILGVSLDSAESRTSLHVALLARQDVA